MQFLRIGHLQNASDGGDDLPAHSAVRFDFMCRRPAMLPQVHPTAARVSQRVACLASCLCTNHTFSTHHTHSAQCHIAQRST